MFFCLRTSLSTTNEHMTFRRSLQEFFVAEDLRMALVNGEKHNAFSFDEPGASRRVPLRHPIGINTLS